MPRARDRAAWNQPKHQLPAASKTMGPRARRCACGCHCARAGLVDRSIGHGVGARLGGAMAMVAASTRALREEFNACTAPRGQPVRVAPERDANFRIGQQMEVVVLRLEARNVDVNESREATRRHGQLGGSVVPPRDAGAQADVRRRSAVQAAGKVKRLGELRALPVPQRHGHGVAARGAEPVGIREVHEMRQQIDAGQALGAACAAPARPFPRGPPGPRRRARLSVPPRAGGPRRAH